MKLLLKIKLWLLGKLVGSIYKEFNFLDLSLNLGKPAGPDIIISSKQAKKLKGWDQWHDHNCIKRVGNTNIVFFDYEGIFYSETIGKNDR